MMEKPTTTVEPVVANCADVFEYKPSAPLPIAG